MKVSVWVAPVATMVIFFGSVGVAGLNGTWITSGREQVAASADFTVDAIKGWMTIQQAADGLGVPVDTIIGLIDPSRTAGITAATAFKEVEALVPEFSLADFRGRLRSQLAAGGAASSPAPASTP